MNFTYIYVQTGNFKTNLDNQIISVIILTAFLKKKKT